MVSCAAFVESSIAAAGTANTGPPFHHAKDCAKYVANSTVSFAALRITNQNLIEFCVWIVTNKYVFNNLQIELPMEIQVDIYLKFKEIKI